MKFTDKLTRKALVIVCATAMVASLGAAPAFADPAADKSTSPAPQTQLFNGTTYRVAVYAGNQGTVNGSDKVVFDGANAVQPGSTFDFSQVKVEVPADSKYYAKGIRLAALDNVQSDNIHGDAAVETTYYATVNDKGDMVATNPATITEDTDFVVAYGILANRVAYTVNYVDADGNQLQEPQTFFGDIGDRPATAPVYIENYLPQATLVVLTLSADETQNVITFRYTRLAEGTTTVQQPSGRVDVTTPDGSTAPGAYSTTVTPEQAAAAAAGAGAGTGDPANPIEQTPLTTDAGTEVLSDDGTPLAVPEIQTINDDENALSAGQQPGDVAPAANTAWIPWAVAAAVIAALMAFVLVRAYRKNQEEEAPAEA